MIIGMFLGMVMVLGILGVIVVVRMYSSIKKLNGGVVNPKFVIDWQHYRNCVLLTNHNELKQLNTKIYKIVEL